MTRTRRGWACCAGVIAAGVFAVPALADAERAVSICAALEADLAAAAALTSPARLAHDIDHMMREIESVERRSEQRGCTGSVIVIRGAEGNVCDDMAAELAALQSRLGDLIARYDAARRAPGAGPGAIRVEMQANGCSIGPAAPERASYSQFRRPFGRGSIIEISPKPPEAAPRPAALPKQHSPERMEEKPATTRQRAAPQPYAHEVIDLDERLENRDVRVVGPEFLPDQSEAIDLKSPVPTFFP